jgi:hypothetical protein
MVTNHIDPDDGGGGELGNAGFYNILQHLFVAKTSNFT